MTTERYPHRIETHTYTLHGWTPYANAWAAQAQFVQLMASHTDLHRLTGTYRLFQDGINTQTYNADTRVLTTEE